MIETLAVLAFIQKWTGINLEKAGLHILAVVVMITGAYVAGIEKQRSEDKTAELRVELATAKQDTAIAAKAALTAKMQTADLERADVKNQKSISDMQTSIGKLPDGCLGDDDFLRRMRGLQ